MKNKILYKGIITIFFLGAIFILLTTISNAANVSMSTSKSSVSPGESFSITVSVSRRSGIHEFISN